ncbi:MAG: hypothetical protein JWO93_2029 [Micrococcaceae bacterium]|jgi:hypothetical protein|nr:hypothetical protein [Micrococcaceae bacterium]
MKLPDILSADRAGAAASLLRDYYTETVKNGQRRPGSYYDTWAGGGNAQGTENRLSADDLLAVSFLKVQISADAAIGLLDTFAGEISALLEQVPADVELESVAEDDLDAVLGPESAAHRLWDLLRGHGSFPWDLGPTATSKILARKRPALIPIYDPIVDQAVALGGSQTQWDQWHSLLRDPTYQLLATLDSVQEQARIPHSISRLRILDVVLWMYERKRRLATLAAK